MGGGGGDVSVADLVVDRSRVSDSQHAGLTSCGQTGSGHNHNSVRGFREPGGEREQGGWAGGGWGGWGEEKNRTESGVDKERREGTPRTAAVHTDGKTG